MRLTLAYDGTAFAGWQQQPGQRTVEGVVAEAVSALDIGLPVSLRVASRTDAGVHAFEQVVSFDTVRARATDSWVRGINVHLPSDVRVQSAVRCEAGYDPRRDSLGKTYRYLIEARHVPNPLHRFRAWQLSPGFIRRDRSRHERGRDLEDWLDLNILERAARLLVGTHDFRAFRAASDYRQQTVRTLERVEVIPRFGGAPELLAIEVRGTAFLKHMVRILAGTLVGVAAGRMDLADFARLLEAGSDRRQAGVTAPPHGLTLLRVHLGRHTPVQ